MFAGDPENTKVPALCLSPCFLDLGANYETELFVERGYDQFNISCKEGFFPLRGESFNFHCPSRTEMLNTYTDNGSVWKFNIEKLAEMEKENFTDMVEKGLYCDECPDEFHKFDFDNQLCYFDRPENLEGLNYIIDGSFFNYETDGHMDMFICEGVCKLSTDVSADSMGNSMTLESDTMIRQSIRYQSFYKPWGEEDRPDTEIKPPEDSVWAATVFFKVPDAYVNNAQFQKVGDFIITSSASVSEISGGSATSTTMIIPPNTPAGWLRTDIRRRFAEGSERVNVIVLSRLPQQLGLLYIDLLQVVPVSGVLEEKHSYSDIVVDYLRRIDKLKGDRRALERRLDIYKKEQLKLVKRIETENGILSRADAKHAGEFTRLEADDRKNEVKIKSNNNRLRDIQKRLV